MTKRVVQYLSDYQKDKLSGNTEKYPVYKYYDIKRYMRRTYAFVERLFRVVSF